MRIAQVAPLTEAERTFGIAQQFEAVAYQRIFLLIPFA